MILTGRLAVIERGLPLQLKQRIAIAISVILLCLNTCGFAQTEAPRLIPRSATVDRPPGAVFATLKNYFSALGPLTLEHADEHSDAIVARRQGVDIGTWERWAYCKVSATNLLDTLQSSSAVATVKITRAGRNKSFVTVTADFNAVYALGSQTSNVACLSNGALENEILTAAGASLPASEPTSAPLF